MVSKRAAARRRRSTTRNDHLPPCHYQELRRSVSVSRYSIPVGRLTFPWDYFSLAHDKGTILETNRFLRLHRQTNLPGIYSQQPSSQLDRRIAAIMGRVSNQGLFPQPSGMNCIMAPHERGPLQALWALSRRQAYLLR